MIFLDWSRLVVEQPTEAARLGYGNLALQEPANGAGVSPVIGLNNLAI